MTPSESYLGDEIEKLENEVKKLQTLLQEERKSHNKINNFLTDKIAILRKALEDIQYLTDPLGGTSDQVIYDITFKALMK